MTTPTHLNLLATICAAAMLISMSVIAVADGSVAQRRKPASFGRKSSTSSLIGTQIRVIDEAGVKQLLARGAPSQERPLLLNFWATWCGPCREEFPDLVKIDNEYRSKGLDFVAISLDDLADMKTAVPKFLWSQRAKMPVFLLDVPDQGTIIQLIDDSWQGDMPATFLYDRQGNVVYKHRGPIDPAELRTAIEQVMTEKKST